MITHIINDDLEIPEPVPSDYFKRASLGSEELIMITDELLVQKHGSTDALCQRPPILSDNCKDLLRKMLTKDRDERITVNRILEHSWFESSPDEDFR